MLPGRDALPILVASPRPLGHEGSDICVGLEEPAIARSDDLGDSGVRFAGDWLVPGDCAEGGFAPTWGVGWLIVGSGFMEVMIVGCVPRIKASSWASDH